VKQIYATAPLSRRETEVLQLLGDGKTTAEIAAKLKINMKTVQAYCGRLKQKLHAANINRLIRIAVLWRAGAIEIVVKETRARAGRKQVARASADKSRKRRLH
jgi:DNA-binding CsgD family transcriptional regulator